MASAVTTTPSRSRSWRSSLMAGISGWTCPLPGPGAARHPWRGPGPTGGAVPRPAPGGPRARSHPSTAMTVLPSTVPVRVHNHDLRRVLRSVGSRSCSTRRMDDCRRQGLPRLQAQGPQIRRGQVGGVLLDGRQAPAAFEHSRHGQGQDREQAVEHAPPIPRVGDVPKEPGPGAGATGQTWWRLTLARASRTRR